MKIGNHLENMSQKCRVKNMKYEWNKKLFPWRIKQNELMSRKYREVCITLNYIEHFLILVSPIIGCISSSAFASLIIIPIAITSFYNRIKKLCNDCKN